MIKLMKENEEKKKWMEKMFNQWVEYRKKHGKNTKNIVPPWMEEIEISADELVYGEYANEVAS